MWNRSPEKAAALGQELGQPVAESPAALEKLYFSVPYRTQKEGFRISYLELQDLFVMNPKI